MHVAMKAATLDRMKLSAISCNAKDEYATIPQHDPCAKRRERRREEKEESRRVEES
jgi:hypothetical protein